MSSGTLLAVCRVHQLLPDSGSVGTTAIDKRPVAGPVQVRPLGIYADIQADRAHHGGNDQAIYAYSQADADYWAEELNREIPAGLFGENLRVAGIDASGAVIGQRWRIGESVVLEVTAPRTPCATFARRMDEPQWVKRFTQAGRIGCYLRVVNKGTIQAGDAISVESTPSHGITIAEFFTTPTIEHVKTLQELHDSGELVLADHYWPYFKRIRSAAQRA